MANVALNIILGTVNKSLPGLQATEGQLRSLKSTAADVQKSFQDSWGEVANGARVAGAAMVGTGTALLGGLIASAKGVSDYGSELHDLSLQTGATVETLSELKYAAEQTGVDLGTVAMGFKFIGRNASEAANGGKEQAEAFARLGVSVKDASGQMKSSETLFMETAAALREVGNENDRTALAMKLFGRSGTALLPMIMDEAGGIKALRDRARELGFTFSGEAANAADKFGDSLGDLQKQGATLWRDLGVASMTTLQPLVEALVGVLGVVQSVTQAHPQLATAFVIVAGGAGALMIPLGAMLMALPGIVQMWNLLTAAQQRNAAAAAEAGAANAAAGAGASAGGAGAAAGGGVTFLGGLMQALKSIGGLVVGALAPIGAAISGVFAPISAALSGIGAAIAAVPVATVALIAAGFVIAAAEIYGVVKAWQYLIANFDKLPAVAGRVAGAIGGFFTSIGGAVSGALGNAWQATVGFFAALPQAVGNHIGFTIGLLLQLPQAVGAAVTQVGAWLAAAGAWFAALPGTVAGAVGEVGQWLTRLPGLAMDAAAGVVSGMQPWFGALPERIAAWFGAVADYLSGLPAEWYRSGVAMVQGLIDGMKSKWTEFVQGIREGLQRAADMLPHSDPKTGPLKGLQASGRALAEEFRKGVDAGFGTSVVAGGLSQMGMPQVAMAGAGASNTTVHYAISVDARGATNPSEVEAAGYRGAQRAIRENANELQYGYGR